MASNTTRRYRSPAEQARAMGVILERVSKELGRPAVLMVRRDDRWVMRNGYLSDDDEFSEHGETLISVPDRLNCQCETELSMRLLGAFLIKEARNPAPIGTFEDIPEDWEEGTPIQRFALEDTTLLVICNDKDEPTLYGEVQEWRTEGEIIEMAVENQGDADQ